MRLPLRTKLLGGFGAVVALMVVLGLLGLNNVSSVEQGAQRINNTTVASVNAVNEMRIWSQTLRKDQRDRILHRLNKCWAALGLN